MAMKSFKGFFALTPDDTLKISLTAKPGEFYRLSSPDQNVLIRLQFNEQTSSIPQIVDIELLAGGFSPENVQLSAGTVTLNIKSHLPRTAGLQLSLIDYVALKDIYGPPLSLLLPDYPEQILLTSHQVKSLNTFTPFLTEKLLLNNRVFRDLFRIQALPKDLQLKVGNTTILFADLKGSTALYEKTGDMAAYNLVQEHFDILKSSINKYSGVLVKTIGDAVMAAFSKPKDGVLSSLDMVENITRMNLSGNTDGEEISIKVGLNSGTVLAVTANDMLDYFGQCVNLAARVQGLANGGEIWLSETIYNDDIQQLLYTAQYRIERQSALLKGISTLTRVYKCFR